jgi:NAD(P)-dependent dehydrogenase (short-subunit alcohol dehydrogenase family)
MNALRGKIVLITGASRGLGRSVALAFAREGARLALAARTAPQLEDVAKEARSLGAEALPVPTDVADPSQVEACVATAQQSLGPIDILVSNAGANVRKPVVELTPVEWDLIQHTNLRPAFLLARAVLPDMLSRGDGHLFLVASIVGRRGGAGSAAYRAAKAGLINFSQSLAAEVKERGIRVTAVLPGALDTPWFHDRPETERPPMLDPEEVARVIVAVASLDRATLVPEISILPTRELGWP